MSTLTDDDLALSLYRLKNDPVRFVREVIGAEPEPWQVEALNAIRDNDRVAIKSGHGVGKSCFQSWLVLWFISTRYPVKVVLTANTSAQIKDVLMAEIAKWHRQMAPEFADLIEIKVDRIELKQAPTESFAVARTSSKETPESLQGFHQENLLFLIDEASGIPDIVFETAHGSLSTKGAKQVLTGNPTRSSGYFFDAFNKMRERWYSMTVSCEQSTRVSPEFIEEMSTQYGPDSSIFGVRVKGIFPQQEDDVLIPLHLVEAAVGRDVEPTGQVIWGLDVARFGDDRTCLIKRRGNTVTEPPKIWSQKDTMQICGLVNAEYQLTSTDDLPIDIMTDVIGIGAGVVDRMGEMGLPVRGVAVSESATVKDKFINRRSELWFELKEWFAARDCKIPDDAALISELTAPRFTFTSTGKLKLETKQEMKKRGIRSPDVADALMMTMESPGVYSNVGGSSGYYKRGELNYPNLGIV